MDIQQYRKNKEQQRLQEPLFRNLCTTCIQPEFSCYCGDIQKFNPQIDFVILIHPIEVRRRIATGRMSHLCLENSSLVMGQDYSANTEVNKLIQDPDKHSVILYPGMESQNLTPLSLTERQELFPKDKKLQIFVIDGTWATARKMVRLSSNLNTLPRICFTPEKPSNFRVRKQPHPACYSTLEAIHHTIELVGPSQGFSTANRDHDKLIHAFDSMVERQLECIRSHNDQTGAVSYPRKTRCTPRLPAETRSA